MDQARVISALRRRRWAILLAVVACTGLTFFGCTRMKREYLGTATLMAQDEATEPVTILAKPIDTTQERDDLTGRQDRIRTVAAIVSSPAVLASVIRDLNLKTTPTLLQNQVEVKEITSQVLRVSVREQDAALASAMINRFVDTFVGYYADLRSRDARNQLHLLEREQEGANRELQEAAGQLERFKRRDNISSLPDQTRVALEQARLTEEERNKAEAEQRDVAARLGTVEEQLARTPATREIRESSTQTKLLERLSEEALGLRTALAKELAVHTDEHPNVRRLKEQLEKLERQQTEEGSKLQLERRIVPNPDHDTLQARARDLRSERDGLAARVSRLNTDLASVQARAAGYSGKDVELSPLVQRYDMAEQRLKSVTERLGQIRSAANLMAQRPAISVVDRTGPGNPAFDLSQGRTLRLTVLAFLMSLVTSVAIAIMLENADGRVRSLEELETHTQLPVISVIPQLVGRTCPSTLSLAAEEDPSSPLAESYHFLANHVLRHTMSRQSTLLMGVSARQGQGATTALCNLAVALARAGRRVVLVEADLRCPSLHQLFGSEPMPGLTEVLRGGPAVKDVLVPTRVGNLRLMPPGSAERDPWSLLWQPRMVTVVEELRDEADYVLINVPAATAFADALCVAPHVDGALLVLRAGEMPNGAEHKVQQWLDEAGVPVMGMVLNGVPTRELESHDFNRSSASRRLDDPLPALALPAPHSVRPVA